MYKDERASLVRARTAAHCCKHELRKACRSPSNDLDNLPAELYPLDSVPMGNYALSVRWSDGHQSLLPYRSFIDGYDELVGKA